jgi:hypothetical protein
MMTGLADHGAARFSQIENVNFDALVRGGADGMYRRQQSAVPLADQNRSEREI